MKYFKKVCVQDKVTVALNAYKKNIWTKKKGLAVTALQISACVGMTVRD